MPAVTRIKTYTRTKKNLHNYNSSTQNSFLFPITGASTAIDSLLAKNIEKRNSSIKESNRIKTRSGRKGKYEARLLENDSFDITINTTFDQLLKAPDIQPVKYCNISLLSGNKSTDDSNIKNEETNLFKVQKTYERGVKTNALSLGKKIKNDKTNEKNLLRLTKKAQKTPEISLQISPDITNGSNVLVARKFTPIASTSKIITTKINHSIFQPGLRHCMQAQNSPNLIASTPFAKRHQGTCEHLSLSPITAKKQLNFKSGWKSLFESDTNKITDDSLPNTSIEDNVIIINSTLNENHHNQQEIMRNNSLIKNDFKFKAIPIVIIEDGLKLNLSKQRKISDNFEKLYSPRVDLTRNSFSKYTKNIDKLRLIEAPYIDLTRYSFTKYLNKNKRKHNDSLVHRNKSKRLSSDCSNIGMSLRSRSSLNENSFCDTKSISVEKSPDKIKSEKTIKKTKRKFKSKIVHGIGLRTRSHRLKIETDTIRNKTPKKPRTFKTKTNIERNKEKTPDKPIRTLRSTSIHLNKINSSVEEKTENKRVLRKRTQSLENNSGLGLSNVKNKSVNNLDLNDAKRAELKQLELSYIADFMEQIKKPTITPTVDVTPVRRSSRTRRKSVLIDEENYSDWGEFQRISQYKTNTSQNIEPSTPRRLTRSTSCLILNEPNTNTIINISDISGKSLFSSQSISDLNSESVNFITKRRGSNKNSSKTEDLSHQTISLQEWEKFSQNNINTIKIDDEPPIQPVEIIDNSVEVNNSVISDTFVKEDFQNIFLKPGKQWFRSLSILRRTNIHNINLNNSNKGRKWRDSVCAVFEKQDKQESLRGVLFDTSDNQHNEIYNITKNLQIPRINSLSRRTTLQIVPISTIKEVSVCRNVKSILDDSLTNKSGYVSTLADESQSILASFDKLSLTTNVEEREETARQIILKRCGQTKPLPFDDCYSQRLLTRCRKIGEGVYGEVFMYKSMDRQCRVMKIIPIEGNQVVNGEHQKKFEEIISEIIIASELSNLRNNKEFSTNGFNELLKICCVQGKYPQHLLDLWNLYDEEQGSENDSPEIFTDEQLYIVLELANGGQDLEAYRFNNAEQSFAVFAQVVCSLAVAESALQFEHRDMHWGNLLISPTNETTTTYRLNGRELEIATKGVNVSIIDFTLSRMTYNNCCIFNDLALDPDLFTATGDYQFDIYRLMRQRNQDDWQRFEPYSNILWLDYTLEKMITQLRYLRINTKTHKTNIRRLTQMRKKIFNYNSATELLNSDAFSQVFLY